MAHNAQNNTDEQSDHHKREGENSKLSFASDKHSSSKEHSMSAASNENMQFISKTESVKNDSRCLTVFDILELTAGADENLDYVFSKIETECQGFIDWQETDEGLHNIHYFHCRDNNKKEIKTNVVSHFLPDDGLTGLTLNIPADPSTVFEIWEFDENQHPKFLIHKLKVKDCLTQHLVSAIKLKEGYSLHLNTIPCGNKVACTLLFEMPLADKSVSRKENPRHHLDVPTCAKPYSWQHIKNIKRGIYRQMLKAGNFCSIKFNASLREIAVIGTAFLFAVFFLTQMGEANDTSSPQDLIQRSKNQPVVKIQAEKEINGNSSQDGSKGNVIDVSHTIYKEPDTNKPQDSIPPPKTNKPSVVDGQRSTNDPKPPNKNVHVTFSPCSYLQPDGATIIANTNSFDCADSPHNKVTANNNLDAEKNELPKTSKRDNQPTGETSATPSTGGVED
ncbi:MAG TPA: hypothetical protein VF596_07095 [Pyrinomonadaceae bacterium]|jgi:hypothetical protein